MPPSATAVVNNPNGRRFPYLLRVNVVSSYLGGIAFVIGSIFFLPEYAAKDPSMMQAGSWLFIIGSFCFLIVGGQDAVDILFGNPNDSPSPAQFVGTTVKSSSSRTVDTGAALAYIFGAIGFIVGSVLFLPNIGNIHGGAWSFIFGSVLFLMGGLFNCLQALESSPTREMTPYYLVGVGISNIVGSALFLCGSIPYLLDFESSHDQTKIYRYAAVLYIVGSSWFLMGGFLNHQRTTQLLNHPYPHNQEQP